MSRTASDTPDLVASLDGMGRSSTPELLVLQAVRVKGIAGLGAVSRRYALDPVMVEELLLDFQAWGWVTRHRYAGAGGWSLTDVGRAEGERLLAEELEASGARDVVQAAHDDFATLDRRFLAAVTAWQIRPAPDDPLALNDHSDWRWDERVVTRLTSVHRRLAPLCAGLAGELERFEGYAERYRRALRRSLEGEQRWVDGTGIDSCHTVWFELHEDLLATLGRERG